MGQVSGEGSVSSITLDGRFVRLRPITQADYGFLWQCRWSPEIMPLWTSGRTLPSFEQYVRELESGLGGHLLTLLLIETSAEKQPIGFVIAFDYSPHDRYAFFNISLAPAYADLGWGGEATLLFLDYLFAYFDLRKVCMDVYDFNHHALVSLLRSGAPQEGRFRGQRYYQGAYHDVIRLGVMQEEWAAARDEVKAMLAAPSPAQSAAQAGLPASAVIEAGAEAQAEPSEKVAAVSGPNTASGNGAGRRGRRNER